MSKYLKLLAVVEEDYEPITGEITQVGDLYHCENVMSIKLGDDFIRPEINNRQFSIDAFIDSVLELARKRSNE